MRRYKISPFTWTRNWVSPFHMKQISVPQIWLYFPFHYLLLIPNIILFTVLVKMFWKLLLIEVLEANPLELLICLWLKFHTLYKNISPILWPPDVKNWLIRKDPDAGKDWRQEEKGTTEDDDWMASPTQWTWVWASSGSWWWTGRPGVLQSMGSQSRTQLSNWTELLLGNNKCLSNIYFWHELLVLFVYKVRLK